MEMYKWMGRGGDKQRWLDWARSFGVEMCTGRDTDKAWVTIG